MAEILFVDHDSAICEVVQRLLKGTGFEVTIAENIEQALAALGAPESRPSVLVLDLVTAGPKRLSSVAEAAEATPQVPLVVTSGYEIFDLVHELAGLQFSGFLKKPFHRADLLESLRKALEEISSRVVDQKSDQAAAFSSRS